MPKIRLNTGPIAILASLLLVVLSRVLPTCPKTVLAMLTAMPEDTGASVVTAAEAEVMATEPTEQTVIAERMPAMIFVLMLFFFMVISPFRFISCRYLDCGYIITEKIALAYMQNTPGL